MTVPQRLYETQDAFPDTESLTVLLVAGRTFAPVAALLDVDLDERVAEEDWFDVEDRTAWAILDVPGGVLAVERSGYGDPSVNALQALSEGGRSAAAIRSNIKAHYRFGCARDGAVLFDDDEYWLQADPEDVPVELRSLFDLAWVGDGDPGPDDSAPFVVGLAMAEVFTGLTLDAARVEHVVESDYFAAPNLVYP